MNNKIKLQDKLNKINFRISIVPILLLTLLLIIVLITISYIFIQNYKNQIISTQKQYAKKDLEKKKIEIISQLETIELVARNIQLEHQNIFKHKKIYNENVKLKTAQNGAYYKTTKEGSSLYYSSDTFIGEKERKKALYTESMDMIFKNIVDNNQFIVQAYFNSYDNMCRIYPFREKIYKQFGSTLSMKDFNFYYLADREHNLKKEPVWSDIYIDPAGKGEIFSCIVPIYNGSKLEGVSGLDVTIKIIKDILNIDLIDGYSCFLVNKTGKIYSNKIKNLNFDNKEYITLKIKINKINSELWIVIKKDTIFSKINILYNKIYLLFVLLSIIYVIFLVIILYFIKNELIQISNKIIAPIEKIRQISKNIENYKQYLPFEQSNIIEISDLNNNTLNIIQNLDKKIAKATKELKIKNKYITDIFDVTMESINIYDEHHNFVQANRTAYEIFGYDQSEDLSHLNILDTVPKEEQYKVEAAIKNNESKPYEINLYRKDKTIFPALVKGKNIIIEDDAIYRVIVVVDLTEIKQKDEQLIQQSRFATMGEMIGNIAHQWRQPLNNIGAVMMRLEMLNESKCKNKKIDTIVEDTNNSLNYLSKTIDDFRNFFKSDKIKEEFSTQSVINQSIAIIKTQLDNHNIKLLVDDRDGKIKLYTYKNELIQVILNIINNSKDVLIQKQKDIEFDAKITIIIENDINKNIIITIKDNGGGIPNNLINKIFDPYFTTKFKSQGTGIGLYMSKMIIEKNMNGTLTVFNDNEGAVFKIELENKDIKI